MDVFFFKEYQISVLHWVCLAWLGLMQKDLTATEQKHFHF